MKAKLKKWFPNGHKLLLIWMFSWIATVFIRAGIAAWAGQIEMATWMVLAAFFAAAFLGEGFMHAKTRVMFKETLDFIGALGEDMKRQTENLIHIEGLGTMKVDKNYKKKDI